MSLTWVSLFTNETMTKGEFITQLRTRIDEDTADIISDVQIGNLINQGLRDINFRTGLLPEYMEVALDGSASYALAEKTGRVTEVGYIDTESRYSALSPLNRDEITDRAPSVSIPEYYIRNGNNIAIFGSAITTGTLRVYAERIPTIPIDAEDNIDLPDSYIELLFYYCIWWYKQRRREPDEIIAAQKLYIDTSIIIKGEVETEYGRGVSFYGQGAA